MGISFFYYYYSPACFRTLGQTSRTSLLSVDITLHGKRSCQWESGHAVTVLLDAEQRFTSEHYDQCFASSELLDCVTSQQFNSCREELK